MTWDLDFETAKQKEVLLSYLQINLSFPKETKKAKTFWRYLMPVVFRKPQTHEREVLIIEVGLDDFKMAIKSLENAPV